MPILSPSRFLLVHLAVAVSTSSCTARYVPPTSGPTATVTFTTTERTPLTTVFTFDSRECDNVKAVGSVLHVEDRPDVGRLVAKVRAEAEYIATFRMLTNGYINISCYSTVAFKPKDGEDYTLTFDYDSIGRVCRSQISRWDSLASRFVRPEEVSLSPPRCKY